MRILTRAADLPRIMPSTLLLQEEEQIFLMLIFGNKWSGPLNIAHKLKGLLKRRALGWMVWLIHAKYSVFIAGPRLKMDAFIIWIGHRFL